MSSYQHIKYADQKYQHILYEVKDKIARITLNRPESVNVQSTILLEELDHAIDAAGADHEVRVICLFGAGKSFSAGHDLGSAEEMEHRKKFPLEEGQRGFFDRTWRLYVDMHLRWRNIPKPMICAVQGYCIFGGWMVASTADIIFAGEDAKFLCSAFQYFAVPYDIHPRIAKELLFQSRFIDAGQAKEYGLVNRVIPNDRLVEETLEYAADVARNDPFDMRTTKLAVNQALDAQGFTNHIINAHSTYNNRRMGSFDPGYVMPKKEGVKRQPLVQVALNNYERDKKRREANAAKADGDAAARTDSAKGGKQA